MNMNWLKYLVGISALIIAGCAAYFSVTGLGVLFSGASISVMIMASSLELAKLVAATYLKQKWTEIKGFNKIYLTLAVGALMLITSAGIFGYLSNAFQQQNIKLDQVQREISVWSNKIQQDTAQIAQLTGQINQLNSNQGKIIGDGNVNNRILKSVDSRDKQIAKLQDKIGVLQDSSVRYNEKINEIKNNNIDLEKEVGGFRFVAEAFGLELNTVVKFFIFLIVIVFDPLAIALIIAFNGLIAKEKEISEEPEELPLSETDKNYKNYEVYGDKDVETPILVSERDAEVFSEAILNPPPVNEVLKQAIIRHRDEPEVQFIPNVDTELNGLNWETYMHPNFPWHKPELWVNNGAAVDYWIKTQGGTLKQLNQIRKDLESTKTY
jgi:cell division protein FtsB